MFADDVVLIAATNEHLQEAVTEWGAELEGKEMVLNANKYNVTHVGREEGNGLVHCREEQYRYLGAVISRYVKTDHEMEKIVWILEFQL